MMRLLIGRLKSSSFSPTSLRPVIRPVRARTPTVLLAQLDDYFNQLRACSHSGCYFGRGGRLRWEAQAGTLGILSRAELGFECAGLCGLRGFKSGGVLGCLRICDRVI